MANNLVVGNNGAVSKVDISFADAGITGVNCSIIFKVGNPNLSYIPGRLINAVTGFELEAGYYMVMKTALDLSAYLVPPVEVVDISVKPGDTFNAADMLDITGRLTPVGSIAWEEVSDGTGLANIGIISNKAKITNTVETVTPSHSKMVLNSNSINVDARATVGAIGNQYLITNVTDANNYIQIDLRTCETKTLFSGSVLTPIAASGTSIVGDIIRAVRSGTSISVFRNATLIGSGAVPVGLNATKHGIFIYDDDFASIDKFEIV